MKNLLENSNITSADSFIDHFCKRMSEEQWMMLKSGSPDAACKIQIAELVLGMIKNLTTNVLSALETMKIQKSEEEVVDSVTEVIANISLQTLSFSDRVDSVQSKRLSTLIKREVTESITSSLHATSRLPSSFLDLKQRMVNPYRLNAMVMHASNMLKNMKVKMKTLLLRPRLKRKRDGPGSSQSKEEKEVRADRSSHQKSLFSKFLSSIKSSSSKMTEGLHDEIRNVAGGIVTPLIHDLPQKEVEFLLSDINEGAQSLSEDIGAILSTKKSNRLCKNIKSRIKNFFTNCITKVWRCRMLEQLKNMYKPENQPASSPLVESLVENISSQLQMCVKEKPQNFYFSVAIDDINMFVEELYCMINRYFTADEAKEKVERLSVAMRRDMCSYVKTKVWIFVGLMNWWLTTQVSVLSEKVTLDDREEVPAASIDPEEGKSEEAEPDHTTQEILVSDLVDKILRKIYKKTHMYSENRQRLHKHLCELICSNIEKEDLPVPLQDLKDISDRIYKEWCRKWGGAHNVVSLLNLNNHVVDMCFVSVFRHQLTIPPQRLKVFSFFKNCIRRLFT